VEGSRLTRAPYESTSKGHDNVEGSLALPTANVCPHTKGGYPNFPRGRDAQLAAGGFSHLPTELTSELIGMKVKSPALLASRATIRATALVKGLGLIRHEHTSNVS
jgi:hypothetical protein